jgi:hypothetical protein
MPRAVRGEHHILDAKGNKSENFSLKYLYKW